MMVARTKDVQAGLFLRKFGVPYWAIVKLHGRNIAFWCRLGKGIGFVCEKEEWSLWHDHAEASTTSNELIV